MKEGDGGWGKLDTRQSNDCPFPRLSYAVRQRYGNFPSPFIATGVVVSFRICSNNLLSNNKMITMLILLLYWDFLVKSAMLTDAVERSGGIRAAEKVNK